ncbi:RNA methyltransferase [Pseudomonas neustonica]|uniref:RNA methyltransferase n=1 Tax=Pseudomonas TaxID=286 RepID=UPI000C91B944|nr:RNA methyltransferase [Pseudomonas sp. 5Ae-yellow]MAB23385.1 23S rRNA methyltransferase [Pseudomonadales bacterium]MBA6418406.1 RNA methyltransferase [Pseudomonas sp. 5Ae-yellow]|tara:strand:- start:618 stop:1145 length:528 start_codon:yes stop_codon:yes gene_type:complete
MNDPQVLIGLSNPKSPTNVGAILRAAGCFNAHAVRYTGTRHDRAAQFNTDTQKVNQRIPATRVESLLEPLPAGTQIVCIELVEGAVALPEFVHPQRALYVFGPEDGTLEQALIDRADAVVYIPTQGCLNLAATVNLVLYDRLCKDPQYARGDELIRRSRDTNNNVRIRGKPASQR